MRVLNEFSKPEGFTVADLEELAKNKAQFLNFSNQQLKYFTGNPEPKTLNFTKMSFNLANLQSSSLLTEDQQNGGIPKYVGMPVKIGDNSFSIEITNASTTDTKTLTIFPGNYRGNTTLAPNTILDTVTSITVASKESNKTLEHLLAYINANPTVLENIRVESSNAVQVQQPFFHTVLLPFSPDVPTKINPAKFRNEFQNQDTILNLKERIFLGANTTLSYPVKPSTTVTLTFEFSVSTNLFVLLQEMMKGVLAGINFTGQEKVTQAYNQANAMAIGYQG